MVLNAAPAGLAPAEGEAIHQHSTPAVLGGLGFDLFPTQPRCGARIRQGQLLAIGALGTVSHKQRVGRFKAPFCRAARGHPGAQHMQLCRGQQGGRLQQKAVPHYCNGLARQCGEKLFGKALPRLQCLGIHTGCFAAFSFTVFAARQFHRRGIRRLLQFSHKMALAAITGPDAAAIFCL